MSKSTISTFELFSIFPNEGTARTYLEGRLWPDGVKCPACKSGERITTRTGGYYRCNACKLDFTVRTGTIFERSHVPLHKWLGVLLAFDRQRDISSAALAAAIEVTQKSAWYMLRRIKEALMAQETILSERTLERSPTFLQGGDRVKNPPELDRITDMVLAYRPKPKTKAAKRRLRRKKRVERIQRESSI